MGFVRSVVLLVIIASTHLLLSVAQADMPGTVKVAIYERVPAKRSWDFKISEPTETFSVSGIALVNIPQKYDNGLRVDRSNPLLIDLVDSLALPAGKYEILLRSRGAARLLVDDKVVVQTRFLNPNASGHEQVPDYKPLDRADVRPLPPGDQQRLVSLELDGRPHRFKLQAIVGGKNLRAEVGELLVAVAREGGSFRVLGANSVEMTDRSWSRFLTQRRVELDRYNTHRRRMSARKDSEYWGKRREIARQVWKSHHKAETLPATTVPRLPNPVDRFIDARLVKAGVKPTPLTDDYAFLRRVTLDTAGVIPTRHELLAFETDKSPQRRETVINRLLADARWADHWVGYWQDVLAENPGILKPKLNNTGPFRWWIYESFLDNKPIDRFATELVMMGGSRYGGGPAGFGMATENDAPMAAKAHVIAKAFLGVEMQCARCHDAPQHDVVQRDTFRLAAMLAKSTQTLPKTSSVPLQPGDRQPGVEITLRPGDKIKPVWPFPKLSPEKVPPGLLRNKTDSRERLAVLITSPHNKRFARVIVNRLWKRYLGRGLVEPVDDWERATPSHPELLDYLAGELVTNGYDLKHVARLILTSETYQRTVQTKDIGRQHELRRLFATPSRRRMSAEQLVDSLMVAVDKSLRSERMTLDPEGRRPITAFLNLGIPRRAWQFASLSNERDRPALALPRAQTIVDVLSTFGWRDSRADPITTRDQTATILQPLMLANGVVTGRVASLSDDSGITTLALRDKSVGDFVDDVYLKILSRRPNSDEKQMFVELLSAGYRDRVIATSEHPSDADQPRNAVSWSNHLSPEATRIKLQLERAAQAGDPPTRRLRAGWREAAEDMVWALVNSPEFMFVP